MIETYIKKTKNLSFLLSYSGGLDSTFLFFKLLRIKDNNPKLKFRAIHINHQLNKNSGKWSKHCYDVCKKHNIPLIIKKIKVKENKIGIEASARLERYKKIYEQVFQKEIILTAHNLNDQCETFLLALKRGSGITGLSGIPYESKLFGKQLIVRPLLKTPRSKIENWIKKNNVNWIEDESNYDVKHDRNFIRHKILPLLTKRWPSFIKNCAKSSFILKKEKKILDPILKNNLDKYLILSSILDIENFEKLLPDTIYSLLRTWIKSNSYIIPSHKVVKKIYYEIILSKKDSKAKIKIGDYEVKRYKSNLHLIKIIPCIKNLIIMWYKPMISLKLPHNLGCITQNKFGTILPLPKPNELINIRFQTSGKILIQGNSMRKPIKKIWQDHGIAPWNRNKIPLLFYNNELISALGVFVVSKKKCHTNIKEWKLSWIQNKY
ncbi:hypothetical protein XW81_00520 [Buchnera aphidicola (Schlechtendalia chinensis)]|uniref:tRNA(Ile)-lysidine synthase n=1 Tax=Buchnera aphidicola subsp. Schlechtendalia chinensis TaxID=118110 RepID=A0A172WD75_BUCSC|nr:tRNA lysidine(34) synthetase TilS [Buchnera aphidicola]ANF16917.1 hypothetical protein XW81_00520 [Buchnera aphidicola (Schlechtendalia chinensis)]